MPSPAHTTIKGVLERIIFFNEENNYCIAELKAEQTKDKVTVVGIMPGAQCGETLNIRGDWTTHPTHGSQFKVRDFKSELPASVYGIRKYLGSGLVKGISQGLAERIVKKFGEKTLQVISEDSGRLQEVEGIGKQRARSIKVAWDAQFALRDVMVFLQTYGVTVSQCLRIVKQFGSEARLVLENEPYRVARETQGIGFKTADKIAINMGIANDSPQRIDAGIEFALQELQDDGHTAALARDLVDQSTEMLDTDRDKVRQGLIRLFDNLRVKRIDAPQDTVYAQLPFNAICEEKIASTLMRIQSTDSSLPPIQREKAVAWAQEKAGFTFANAQRDAILNALANKISILTGGPGTGKTTILRALVSIVKIKKARVLLAAPTGRAAQRLSESAGAYAQTIHRLLKFDPGAGGFTVTAAKPLSADFVIVDEASMLDTHLAASLMQAIPSKSHLILVGDVDQLPSVGAGNILKDLIASEKIPVTRLDVVFRQKKHSSITYYAHAANRGEVAMPHACKHAGELVKDKDFQFVEALEQDACAQAVVDICQQFIRPHLPYHPIHDTQVLAPMHKGAAGVGNINRLLQEKLNPETQALPFGSLKFKVGDKVLQTRNNYDKGVYNGDIGVVKQLDGVDGTVDVEFDGERYNYAKSDLMDLALAYAVSIHKSQGSEYPVVIVPLMKAHFVMLQRNLVYTAITRGKKKVILVGDPAAYAMAIRNTDSQTRCTLLRQRLDGSIS